MLRLITYLAPSIPAAFFELLRGVIADAVNDDVQLRFEERISGPLPGDENPFREQTADVGFMCAPGYRWMKDELDLLPVPVPLDERAAGRPVYFADVVVRKDAMFDSFAALRARRWAFNDRNSRSGWFSMVERVAPDEPEAFFSQVLQAGSHLESLRLVETGGADAAAIDSNVLRRAAPGPLRVLETWGPFAIQPVVIRAAAPAPLKAAVRGALLSAHLAHGAQLASFGFARFVEPVAADYEEG